MLLAEAVQRYPDPGLRPARRALAIIVIALLGGCNTMSGVGRDLTGSAEFLQGYMPPALQNGLAGYWMDLGHGAMSGLADGVPPLGAF